MKKLFIFLIVAVMCSGCTVGLEWKNGKLGFNAGLDGTQIVDGVEGMWSENRGESKYYDKVEKEWKKHREDIKEL